MNNPSKILPSYVHSQGRAIPFGAWITRTVNIGRVALIALAAASSGACTAKLGNDDSSEDGRRPSGGGGSKDADGQPITGATKPGAKPQLYLLTRGELGNSLESLLDTTPLLENETQPDRSMSGFASAGASEHSMSSLGVDRWETAIDSRLAALFENETARADLVGCTPSSAQDPCVDNFIREFGMLVWRRPLTEPEVTRYASVVRDTAAEFEGDPWEGLRYGAQALLQSPYFLNRVYLGEPLPSAPQEKRLTAYELATKLAYALTQSPPDELLQEAAAQGTLQDSANLKAHAVRLLGTPQAHQTLIQFCRDLFSLSPLLDATRGEEVIDALTGTLLAEMEQESIQFCLSGITGGDLRDAFVASETELGPELAQLYGAPSPGPGKEPLPDPNRSGVLTSAGFLTVLAHADRTSPTLRGRFVRERLLCQEIPEPPPEAVTELPEAPQGQSLTMRERLAQHASDSSCAGCHALTDPIGFALEHFDSIGRFRQTDNGASIDATGDLDEFPFDGAQELSAVVVDHPKFPRCLATQWFRFSEARLESRADAPFLNSLGTKLAEDNFNFQNAILELTLSDEFRAIRADESL